MRMEQKTNPLHSLKRSNRGSVLEAIRAAGPSTIADVAERTGLSKVTVTKCVGHYVREGLVFCAGKGDAAEERGKRPALYSFNKLHRLAFCVKIDEVHLLAALTDLEGGIVASHSAFYNASTPLESVLGCIRDAFRMLLERTGRSARDCIGAVVGCHGVIDPELGICFVSPHFSGWGLDIPIRELVAALLPPGIPVYVNNWIQFHAYGEVKAMRSAISRFFLIGTESEGVAGGLVIDGRMYRGSGSLSGEIAHMIVDTRPDAELCECGGKGCFEASISPCRLSVRADQRLKCEGGAVPGGLVSGASFRDIAAAADAGDSLARSLVDEVIGHWAIGVTNIVQICDPELIIIQGEYARAGAYFLANLTERLQTVSLLKMRKTVEIAYSDLEDQGTIRGAGHFATERYFLGLE